MKNVNKNRFETNFKKETAKIEDYYEAVGINEKGEFVIYSKVTDEVIFFNDNNVTVQKIISHFTKDGLLELYSITNDKGFHVKYDMITLQSDLVVRCRQKGNFHTENLVDFGIYEHPLDKNHLIFNSNEIHSTYPDFNNNRLINKTLFNKTNIDLDIDYNIKDISFSELNLIREAFNTYNFKSGKGAEYVFGWFILSAFSGVLDWRSHMYITAQAGSGKSHLIRFISGMLNKLAHTTEGSQSTAAGLRKTVSKGAIALLLDESESDAEKINNILQLLRSASSKGAKVTMASKNGNNETVEYKINTSALMVGITPPNLNNADKTRFIMLDMNTIKSSLNYSDELYNCLFDKDFQKEIGNKIILTTYRNYSLLKKVIKDTKKVFSKLGIRDRYADTHGQVIAASFFYSLAFELFRDEIDFNSYEIEQLEEYIKTFDLTQFNETDSSTEDDQILNIILKKQLSNDRLEKTSVLQHIINYKNEFNKKETKNLLGEYGIRPEIIDNDIHFYINCDDINLKQSFLKNTTFERTNIKNVLERNKDCLKVKERVSINNMRINSSSLLLIKLNKDNFEFDKEIKVINFKDGVVKIDEENVCF